MKNIVFLLVCYSIMTAGLNGRCNTTTENNNTESLAGYCSDISDYNNSESEGSGIPLKHAAVPADMDREHLLLANGILNSYMQARVAYNNQKMNEALEYIKQSLDLFESADAWALKAFIYHQMGETEKSRNSWSNATQLSDRYHFDDFHNIIKSFNRKTFIDTQCEHFIHKNLTGE